MFLIDTKRFKFFLYRNLDSSKINVDWGLSEDFMFRDPDKNVNRMKLWTLIVYVLGVNVILEIPYKRINDE